MVKGKWRALAFLAVDTVAKLNLLAGTLESKISEKFYIERLCPDKPVTSLQLCGSRQRPGTAALQRGGGGLITSSPDTQRLCLGPQSGLQHCSTAAVST